MPAGHTAECRLTNPVRSRGVPAASAFHRRAPWIHLDQHATAQRAFIGEHAPGLAPRHTEDRAVQPVLAATGLSGPKPGDLVEGAPVSVGHRRTGLVHELLASSFAL